MGAQPLEGDLMEVKIESNVEVCPSPCRHADISIQGEVLRSISGAEIVYVSVGCSHDLVCDIRKAAARGDD